METTLEIVLFVWIRPCASVTLRKEGSEWRMVQENEDGVCPGSLG